jgi:hypothetical protein
MLWFYRQKEDAIVIIFEKERVMSVIKWKKEKHIDLNVKSISTRMHTYFVNNKRKNTETLGIISSTAFDAH